MTAKGTHEHYECDGCRRKIVVLVNGTPADNARNPTIAGIAISDGGSRLEGIHHLCTSCAEDLRRHFFGPNGCDGPKVVELERLLKRARTALQSQLAHEKDEYIGSDIDTYFNPGTRIEIEP